MTLTFKDKQRNALLKKYHTLCGRVGLDDYTRRMMLVQHYNDVSSENGIIIIPTHIGTHKAFGSEYLEFCRFAIASCNSLDYFAVQACFA